MAASSSAAGTTSSTIPQARAFSAPKVSPVINRRRVRPQPIRDGNRAASITLGMPTRTSGMPITASSLAMRMSQAAAISSPPPRQ